MKKTVLLALMFLLLFLLVPGSQWATSADNQYSGLTRQESEIIRRINGTNVYNYDLELEKTALDTSISNYAFRSAGSTGANEAAQWIKKRFESFGLETSMEQFEFTNWNLLSKPSLLIDDDGSISTLGDQEIIQSFQPAHYSWSTPEGGVFGDLVTLSFQVSDRREITKKVNINPWSAINIKGKIVLVGREFYWNKDLRLYLASKLRWQPPAAIIYTWWYDWMSFSPPMLGSIGGRSDGASGPQYWDLKIPVGWVNYEDGLRIRNRESSMNVSASLTIPAVIGYGPSYNVVGKLKGSVNPDKFLIISGHYDTVMTSGFCDNGAGTAGVIELARVFANAAKEGEYKPEQTLIFVAFTGEELGFVGAINYIRQHKAEMKDISAVINLDCIGSDVLQVAETFPNDDGLDLDEIVLRRAEDLGVKAELEGSGGSDQEAFRNPLMAETLYDQFWRADAGIENVTRVKASTMLSSYPLFYSDKWEPEGVPGWIHTQYDNSTSTSTLNWVEVDDLEAHVKVAALSVTRVLSILYSPFLSQVLTFTMVVSVLVAATVYVERSRVSMALKKTYDNIYDYIGMRELVFISILTVVFLFMSFVMHTRIAKIEVIVRGLPGTTVVAYYGYPFEMLGIEQKAALPPEAPIDRTFPTVQPLNYSASAFVLWNGLFLNFALYFLLALGLTFLGARLTEFYASRKLE